MQSLQDLLEDPIGVTYFLQYYLAENMDPSVILLWIDIDTYRRQLDPKLRTAVVHKIYNVYLRENPKSPNYVKLEDNLYKEQLNPYNVSDEPPIDLYNKVRHLLLPLMFIEGYSKFLASELHAQYDIKKTEMVCQVEDFFQFEYACSELFIIIDFFNLNNFFDFSLERLF